ncbi:hypothetical protein AB2E30_11140 [Escherichia coli]
MPLPQSLESGELAKLDVKDKALLAQDRTIAASQMQLEQLNKLPARCTAGAGISPATPA